jgi:hypothetical protein
VVAFRSGGRLVGTVSVDIYPFEHEGRALTVVFTSSTILDDSVRGGTLIQRAGVASYLRGLARAPLRPVYWLFDTFSYKSYLLLARNFVEYWPRRDADTPPATTRLLARLAEERYGAAWQPERGSSHARRTSGSRNGSRRFQTSCAAIPTWPSSPSATQVTARGTCWYASRRSHSPTGAGFSRARSPRLPRR